MLLICKFLTKFVILSEAKDLLSCYCARQQVLRFAQDDKMVLCCELQSRLNPRSWVQQVAQRIADKVEGQHREHHRHGREEHEMRSVEQVRASVVEHRSPTRGGRWDA